MGISRFPVQRVDLPPQTDSPHSSSNGSPRSCTPNTRVDTRVTEPAQDSTPIGSTRSQVLIPRAPMQDADGGASRSRCLTPLNLSSLINQQRQDNIMEQLEAFFVRQQEFNERLEQRVTVAAECAQEKERQNAIPAAQTKVSKALSVSH